VVAFRRLKFLVYRAVQNYFEDGCSHRAAAISYYVLFSMFPIVIFSVGILGLILRDPELQAELVDTIMESIPLSPDEGREDVSGALEQVAGTPISAIGAIGLVALLWAGSAMFGVIRSALNTVYRVQTPRPIVLSKLLDLVMVLTIAPFFVMSVVATSALRFARDAVEDLPVIGGLAADLGIGWWIASTMLPILVSFTAFFFLYWLVPARRMKPAYIVIGALLAAVLFEAVKIGFNIYLENFGRYDVIFGSLGAVVAFLFWVYLSASIMLLSAEFIAALPEVMSGRYDVPDRRPKEPLTRRALHTLRGLVISQPKESKEEKGRPGG
jgi:membrane protein